LQIEELTVEELEAGGGAEVKCDYSSSVLKYF
jgi:hypothetical protein